MQVGHTRASPRSARQAVLRIRFARAGGGFAACYIAIGRCQHHVDAQANLAPLPCDILAIPGRKTFSYSFDEPDWLSRSSRAAIPGHDRPGELPVDANRCE